MDGNNAGPENLTVGELVLRLAILRQTKREIDEEYRLEIEAFEAEHAKLMEARQSAKEEVASLEQEIKARAIERFMHDGQKRGKEPVSIRVKRQISYREDEAISWAEENAPYMVSRAIDVKAFKRVMLDVPDDQRPAGVQIVDVPQAIIKRDLSSMLGEA